MNTQPIEKKVSLDDPTIELHSVFRTIQGEGPFCGTPAIFVRLAGCNLQCPQCDTDYTSRRRALSSNEVATLVAREESAEAPHKRTRLVVITGGEPFRQNIGPLINELIRRDFYVQVETNGTLPPPDGVEFQQYIDERTGAYIVCSPKAGRLNSVTEREACCFKYVMDSVFVSEDGLPTYTLGHGAAPRVARPQSVNKRVIYLQPADQKDHVDNKANLDACVKSCLDFGYVLQLQVHKLIGVE